MNTITIISRYGDRADILTIAKLSDTVVFIAENDGSVGSLSFKQGHGVVINSNPDLSWHVDDSGHLIVADSDDNENRFSIDDSIGMLSETV